MIAREFTLKSEEEFKRVFSKGKNFRFPSFGLVVYNREDETPSKFGFIVSLKISKHSVHRNRIKRVLGEAVRFESAYLAPGFDVVFLAKELALKKSTPELMKEVKEALREAKLYK